MQIAHCCISCSGVVCTLSKHLGCLREILFWMDAEHEWGENVIKQYHINHMHRYGKQTYTYAAPKLWNDLLDDKRETTLLDFT